MSHDELGNRAGASDEPDGPSIQGPVARVLLGQGGVSVGAQPNRVRGTAGAAESSDDEWIARVLGKWPEFVIYQPKGK